MWQAAFMISGYILIILGFVMLIPAGLDASDVPFLDMPFVVSALITVFFGFLLFLSNHVKIERISLRQGYLTTIVSWVAVCLFSSLPFILCHCVPNISDAVFEATSGITGTGATIMENVEKLPQSVLMWRSLLNYIGGLGVVIFAVALLPFLGIGGMQIFQHENSDSNDKFMPKFSYIAKRIVFIYLSLMIIASCALYLCGMGWFDAVNHAMSAIGTGGFSTKNNSIAAFHNISIELCIMIFMLAGALPMTFYILLLRGTDADRNGQVRTFLKIIGGISLIWCIYLYCVTNYSWSEVLRYGIFTVISIVTTTGLSSVNYIEWGVWVTAGILFLSLIGGCTGSTCGSIKTLRWQVVFAFLRKHLISAIDTHRVVPLKIGTVNMSEKVTISVFVYLLSFIICCIGLILLVSSFGIDFKTSAAAVIACIANVGIGSVDVIGPAGNYAFFSQGIKGILCFAMLLGRLEIMTILVLLTKSFWRD
ncbi:MAG: TrkH family potassium uptake protein [Alphaproteobacteria bacterium]|nr:TrkH family potassium uptake protein [Alphaproteobacteria bacterium]